LQSMPLTITLSASTLNVIAKMFILSKKKCQLNDRQFYSTADYLVTLYKLMH
jgi:hypothetical protein